MKRLILTRRQYDRTHLAGIRLTSDPPTRQITLPSDTRSPREPMRHTPNPASVDINDQGGRMVPRRTSITITLLASAALAAATAGCGNADSEKRSAEPLTKAQVIQRGSVICRAAEKQAEKLPEPKTEDPFAPGTSAAVRRDAVTFLNGYADALDSTRVGLQQLNAPAQDRGLLDDYIAGVSDAVSKFRQAATDASPRAMNLANEGFAIFEQISKKTAAYGFPKGVCGSGEAS